MTERHDDEHAVRAVLDEVVAPLLQLAGGDAELVEVSADAVTIRLLGQAAHGPGAALLREDVVGAAIGPLCAGRRLAFEQGGPSPARRAATRSAGEPE
ncbi:MAG: NifU family protein [Myxococcota bacterium]